MHTLAPKKGSRTKAFRIGRGPGSGRGKTAGRGTKGQRSRTGGKKKLGLKGMRHMLLAFPKMHGFQSRFPKAVTLTLKQLEKHFENGALVNIEALRNAGLLVRTDRKAKIVGTGVISKKITVSSDILVSETAKAAIEKAGGSFAVKKPVAKPVVEKQSKQNSKR